MLLRTRERGKGESDGDPSTPFDLKEANQSSNFILVFKG